MTVLALNQIRANARKFSLDWQDAIKENAESQTFWNEFFEVFGVNRRKVGGLFEMPIKKQSGTQGRIDVFWKKRLLCEQKSRGEDLDKAITQALGYLESLDQYHEDDFPRYVIVCDFQTLKLFDTETQDSRQLQVADLADHIELFGFMSGYEVEFRAEQEAVSIAAALQMGKLHDQLKKNGYDGHPLKVMLIRLLFCMFAEDTGIFNLHQFKDFIEKRTHKDGSDLGDRLSTLFYNLNLEKRQSNLDETIAAFPYINGELFAEMMPPSAFDALMRQQLIDTCYFDWKSISPEIFGALFQSVMHKDERRNLGAHYTSEENILKVINSLFLAELRAKFEEIKAKKQSNIRASGLHAFHDTISRMTFLDPACGCGNFLIVAYRELRLLELDVIEQLKKDDKQLVMDVGALIRCNVDQFYGIEIDEFPSQIARVAMWLVDHQMNLLVSARFGTHFARIPLKQSAHIQHANALQVEWPITDFILGNPPFIGHQWRTKEQQADVEKVFPHDSKFGKVDFVGAWFVKAARIMAKTPNIRTAFVSTNSICQGEQVGILWGWIFSQGLHIQFAHRTFVWQSAAKGKAAVHCVIVGFGLDQDRAKTIFEYETLKDEHDKKIEVITPIAANNINQYLVDAPNVLLPSRSKPPQGMPAMTKGSQPTDGGHLIVDAAAKSALLAKYPDLAEFIKPFIGGYELINGGERYCLWFADALPSQLKKIGQYPEIKARIEGVKQVRLASPTASVKELANEPYLFTQNRQPSSTFLAIPEVSSERREYIPIGFLTPDYVPSNKIYILPNVGLYEFGILTSRLHMAWMRVVAGRLKSDYSYSPNVYQLFPWPTIEAKHKAKIEQLAQAVLDARSEAFSKDPKASLATLYDPDFMPKPLRQAHQQLDKAVDAAYGKTKFNTEAERVAFLFELYQHYTAPTAPIDPPTKPKTPRKAAK